MNAVGFEKAEIAVLDANFQTTEENIFTLEGKTDKGATRSFNVEGLTAEAVKQFGSNIPYRTAKRGIGDLSATLTAIDVPLELEMTILGIAKSTEGFYEGGDDTEAPYTAAIFYDKTPQGEPYAIALYRGSWSRNSLEGETLEGENKELPEEEYTMSCVVGDDKKGYGIAVGAEQVAALRAKAFKITPSGGA